MRRETTVRINLRERATEAEILRVVRTQVRPWFDAIEAEGLTYSPPVFTLTPDPVDHWTTHVHVTTETTEEPTP